MGTKTFPQAVVRCCYRWRYRQLHFADRFKNYVRHITALVNMSDDGGSTGVLRDEYGVLPPVSASNEGDGV